MKIDPHMSSYIKLKSKWIKDLNIKPDTLNLIEEKTGKSLELIGTGGNFLNRTPMAHAPVTQKRQSIGKISNIQIVKKIFTNPTSDRGLISQIYKELKKLTSTRPSNPVKNGV